jgi:hypothetical protein
VRRGDALFRSSLTALNDAQWVLQEDEQGVIALLCDYFFQETQP